MFRKVTELAPNNHQGFYNLGAVDFMLGSWTEAEGMFKRSITIHPSASAYSNIGTLTFYEGHFEQSAEYFEKAIQLKPRDSTLWGNLGDAYKWSSRNQKKARSAYLKAAVLAREGLSVNPRSSRLLGDLAVYEAQSSETAKSMKDLQQALALSPKDIQLMYNAAIVYHLAGRRAEALQFLRRARDGGYPVQSIRVDPEWSSLKSDPAFQEIIGAKGQ